jgi:UDP-glucuronate 4-epimerase
MAAERFLVTGSGGCIGAWTTVRLAKEGVDMIALDVSENQRRLQLLLDEAELAKVRTITGDIRETEFMVELVIGEGITHIVHLAGLQVPFCRADPVLGSQVNVTGTINVLEAVRRSDGAVRGLSFASSVAVFGPAHLYEDGVAFDESPLAPATLYGGYKQANEQSAAMYAADWGIGSVGLRPCIVYGPGRDQGLTSDVTKATLAAAAGRDSHIGFGGSSTLQHADDMAATFIAAARLESEVARVHNVPGPTAPIREIADLLEDAAEVSISVADEPLPLPSEIDGSPLNDLLGESVQHRPIDEGLAEDIEHFRHLLAEGKLEAPA